MPSSSSKRSSKSSLPSTPVAGSASSASTAHRAQAEARTAILASLHTLGTAHSQKLQLSVQDLHNASTNLNKQDARVKSGTAALGKERVRWEAEVTKATKALNEVGDLQNWAEVLEREFCVLEETMRLVEGNGGSSAERLESGGSRWR